MSEEDLRAVWLKGIFEAQWAECVASELALVTALASCVGMRRFDGPEIKGRLDNTRQLPRQSEASLGIFGAPRSEDSWSLLTRRLGCS